jgi:osmotically-inducible protein OsmY
MGEGRISPKGQAPRELGVHGMPAQNADPGTIAQGPAVQTPAPSAEPGREWGQAGPIAARLEVHLPLEADVSDEAIAERTLQVLFSAAPLQRERIAVRIARGQVTLSGTVGTNDERMTIERLVAGVEGVAGIVNQVAVERHGHTTEVARGVAETYGGDAESGDVAGRIEAVFVREAGLGATEVMITAVGGKVTLSGHVHSWRERDLAERLAWATPGVTEILDRITVR